MATEIEIVDLTNGSVVNQEWVGSGVFDALMAAVNKNIEIQYQKGRITGQDYAQVYLGALQSTLQQSVEFLLRKDLTEVQIDDARKDIETKERQMVLQESKLADDLLTSAKQRTILDTEEQAKQYEVDNILPANLAVLQKQDDELQTKIELMAQQKLTEVEQTRGANATADKAEYEVSNLLPLQKADAEEAVKLRRTEKIGKDKEVAALGLDNVMKQSETSRLSDPSFVYTPRYSEV
jgi:hypothetical protein